jgi:hypothetical protein
MMIALQEALRAKIAVIAGDTPVLDYVPHKQAKSSPKTAYITIGDDDFVQQDADVEKIFNVAATIHIWTIERGRDKNKIIANAIYKGLHREGWQGEKYKVVACDLNGANSARESDGATTHGVLNFNLIVEVKNDGE